MKVMAINAGSSSLKFQLLEMPSENLLASGVVERIGLDDAVFTIKFGAEKSKEVTDIPTHKVAVDMLLNKMIDLKILHSLDEIEALGHRVVHGGEKFSDSVIITDEVINAIEEVSELAPLHNPGEHRAGHDCPRTWARTVSEKERVLHRDPPLSRGLDSLSPLRYWGNGDSAAYPELPRNSRLLSLFCKGREYAPLR